MRSGFLALVVCLAACGASDDGSVANAPTSTDTAPKLGGAWTGTLASTGGSTTLTVKWTANQTGSDASGPVTITLPSSPGQSGFTVSGTMNGTVTGTTATISLTVPPGSFSSIGGPAACKLTATGPTTIFNATTVSATLALTFDQSCVGTVSDRATETDQLTLTRQ